MCNHAQLVLKGVSCPLKNRATSRALYRSKTKRNSPAVFGKQLSIT